MDETVSEARREIGKWLNEPTGAEIDRVALAQLCAEYDALRERAMVTVYLSMDDGAYGFAR